MKRIITLISATAIGVCALMAGTLQDLKAEIAMIEGTTFIDASEETKVQEYNINQCELIMLTPEIIDEVKTMLSWIPETLLFADVNDGDTKVTIWAEQEDGTDNGEMLFFVDSDGQLLVLFAQGDLKTMQAGVHMD